MNLCHQSAEIEKRMTTDTMGTIQQVLEKVSNLPQDKRLSAATMILARSLAEVMRQAG